MRKKDKKTDVSDLLAKVIAKCIYPFYSLRQKISSKDNSFSFSSISSRFKTIGNFLSEKAVKVADFVKVQWEKLITAVKGMNQNGSHSGTGKKSKNSKTTYSKNNKRHNKNDSDNKLEEWMIWAKDFYEDNSKLVLGGGTAIVLAIVSVIAFGTVTSSNMAMPSDVAAVQMASQTAEDGTVMEEAIDPEKEMLLKLKQGVRDNFGLAYPGYTLYSNGKPVGFFKTREEADAVVDNLLNIYTPEVSGDETASEEPDSGDAEGDVTGEEGTTEMAFAAEADQPNVDVSFKEDVAIVHENQKIMAVDGYDDVEESLYYIEKGTDKHMTHKVESGENFWVIAQDYNVGVDDLIVANPTITPERLQIGQEISLVVPEPLVTVMAVAEAEYSEDIPYDIVYEDTSNMYKGEYKTKVNGEPGERDVVASVYYENGVEVGRIVLEENIISDPSEKVVYRGTTDPPPKKGTGVLSKPISRGVVTSEFGWRWGRRHEGLDIGLSIGTDVMAADGGEVVFAGTKGGYGKCVIIDHGAGIKTLYAHNSKLYVTKGEKVYKGQVIAASGNTGVSTGPHLHFEVQVNGVPVNPRNYVNF